MRSLADAFMFAFLAGMVGFALGLAFAHMWHIDRADDVDSYGDDMKGGNSG